MVLNNGTTSKQMTESDSNVVLKLHVASFKEWLRLSRVGVKGGIW